MSVRSLNSSVLKWLDKQAVDSAVRAWAQALAAQRPDIVRIGYLGSYARSDWSEGSDLDAVFVLDRSDQPFERRALVFDATKLPVPVDLPVYTEPEFRQLIVSGARFGRVLARETVWIFDRTKHMPTHSLHDESALTPSERSGRMFKLP